MDKRLDINSGFRCLVHNKREGGSDNSQHTLGTAADVSVPEGLTAIELAAIAETIPHFRSGGIGIYDTFVHLDTRPNGPARWKG